MQHDRASLSWLAPRILTGIGILLALAGALAPQQRTPLSALATRIALPLPAWVMVAVVVSLSLASLIFLAIALPRVRRRRKKGEEEYEIYHEPGKVPPWLVVVLILIALAPAGVLGSAVLWLERHEPYIAQTSGGLAAPHTSVVPFVMSPKSEPKVPVEPASAVTSGLFGTIALLIGFGGLVFVLWLLFADRWVRQMPADFDHPKKQLAAAIDESLIDLRREPDARVAITKIYRNFERVLAGVTVPRPPWQTPMEFMRSALAKLPLPAGPVGGLTRLFEIARFSRHPVGEDERETAWRALTEIRAKLDKEAEARRAALS
jgi:Domain of unknown function (DUF4129)